MITMKGVGFLPQKQILVINRLGADTVVGGVYAVDIFGTDGDSTDADSNLSNIIAVATANMKGFMCVVNEIVADNQPVVATVIGRVSARMDGTSAVAEGSPLMAVNAQNYLVIQPAGSLLVGCGLSLEAYAVAAVKLCDMYFDGWALFKAQRAAS